MGTFLISRQDVNGGVQSGNEECPHFYLYETTAFRYS
jgi:hypothetical protein